MRCQAFTGPRASGVAGPIWGNGSPPTAALKNRPRTPIPSPHRRRFFISLLWRAAPLCHSLEKPTAGAGLRTRIQIYCSSPAGSGGQKGRGPPPHLAGFSFPSVARRAIVALGRKTTPTKCMDPQPNPCASLAGPGGPVRTWTSAAPGRFFITFGGAPGGTRLKNQPTERARTPQPNPGSSLAGPGGPVRTWTSAASGRFFVV